MVVSFDSNRGSLGQVTPSSEAMTARVEKVAAREHMAGSKYAWESTWSHRLGALEKKILLLVTDNRSVVPRKCHVRRV